MDLNLKIRRKIVKDYIKNNPKCTYRDIRRATKLKVERLYKNMVEAYKDADVRLSKNLTKRNKQKQREVVIDFIKNNPGCTVTDIYNKTKVNAMRIFGNILSAYEQAEVKYPKKEITSGVMNPLVVKRCNRYEKRMVKLLEELGEVHPKVRTKGGVVDCLFKFNNKIFAVEIKDFRGKNNITMFEIKQLVRYMKILNLKHGLLVCPKRSFPKRKNSRNVYIDGLDIKILSEEDLRGRSTKALSVQPGSVCEPPVMEV